MVTADDLAKERRKLFAARCATGDWDVVVMTHSAFTRLPVNPEVERAWLAQELDRYRDAARQLRRAEEGSRTVK